MPSKDAKENALDYETLAAHLRALGFATRLELLDHLRFPKLVSEISLSPGRVGPEESAERSVSRQTIQTHIDTLVEAGFVEDSLVERGGRSLRQYTTSPQRLYATIEELRRISVRYAGKGAASLETEHTPQLAGGASPAEASGPRLVLVHGVYEGKVFSLAGVQKEWLIGRRRNVAVSLDYDPFVSNEHALVRADADGWTVTDLRTSKNGTRVNWRLLGKEAPRRLKPGDVIGAGRSSLVFQTG